jgi:chromosome segregation ATPase
MTVPSVDTARIERTRIPDFIKLIEELKQLKNRSLNVDLARLDEQRDQALATATKDAQKRAKSGSPEEVQRLMQEAKRFVEAEHERTKEMLTARFQKIDSNLLALSQFLQTLGPLKDLEGKLAEKEERLRKELEEQNIHRKVMAREQEDLDRDKELIRSSQISVKEKSKELDAKLANLDVVRREKELNQLKEELDSKLKAYEQEIAKLAKEREELNKDIDKIGPQRAELDRESEKLKKERKEMIVAKAKMADVVAKEMALTFESFVRDMLRPPEPQKDSPEA